MIVASVALMAFSTGNGIASPAHAERPIEGTLHGLTFSTPFFVDPDLVYERCGPTAFAYAASEVDGYVSHLGAVTESEFWHCYWLYDSPIVTDEAILFGEVEGVLTLVGANGDSISGTYSGTIGFVVGEDLPKAFSTVTLTGGTGRFEQATGDLAMVTLILEPDQFAAAVELQLTGRIGY